MAESSAGFAQLDQKGRVAITKAVRNAYGLQAGSTVAWVALGEGILLVPQDEHLARVLEDAATALERAGISVESLLAGLDEARDEVVTEHYGSGYFDRLRATAARGDAAEER